MGSHARALASDEKRRPTYDEAMRFARRCGADFELQARGELGGKSQRGHVPGVELERVKTLACAYSQQWDRCGRMPPID